MIEPKVRPLVEGMNATGVIRTVASCQGHMGFLRAPYVYFKSTVAIAAAIERVLREASMFDDARLHVGWEVHVQFNEAYELAFSLRSPELERRSKSFLDVVWYFGLNRKRLDSDLAALVDIVKQAVLLEVRNEHEPKVAPQGNQNGDCDEFTNQD